jgi:SAM-dependent methyltransferase
VTLIRLLPVLIGAGIIVNGVRLRNRLRRLDTAPPSGREVDPRHEFLVADGVELSAAARRAASNYARREGLEVLDLVPAALTVERALDVARMVDTRTYRGSRMAVGRGAYQALLVHSDVLDRAGIRQRDGIDRIELVALTARLKRYAPVTTDLAVVAGVTPAPDDAARRARVAQAAYKWEPHRAYLPLARDVLAFIGVSATLPWGLATSVVYWVQPFFVCFGRVPIQPRDLYRSPVARILAGVDFVVGSIRHGMRTGEAAKAARAAGLPADPAKARKKADLEAGRARYLAEIAGGVERYLEPPRDTCPWCGSARLRHHLTTADHVLGKPGRFRLDRCDDCRHIFQNPRLTLAGLDFYYRDCYDGINAEKAEMVLGAAVPAHRERARMLRPYAVPRAWLDVGGAHGHFCNVARDIWPKTVFDALDSSVNIDEAVRRRWVDHGYRGMFPRLAPEIAGRYDVISMFHYLEHTREPLAELDCAVKALAPGGHLFIELPNATSPAARLLRSYWIGWFTPQHQHMIPAENLVAALAARGMTTVRVQFGTAHQGAGFPLVPIALLTRFAPAPATPWLPGGHVAARRALRVAGFVVFGPLAVLGAIIDAATRPYYTRGTRATAYRVIARKDG